MSAVSDESVDGALTVVPEEFTLTDLQVSYLFGRRAGTELGGFPARFVVEYGNAPAEPERLADALRDTVARHDATAAVVDEDAAVQRVDPAASRARLRTVDAGTADADTVLREVRSGGPGGAALDAVLVCGEDGARLVVAADLLVIDLPGTLALLAEWRRRFDGDLAVGAAPSFPQAVRIAGQPAAAAGRYWTGRLDELPPVPELPLAVAPAGRAGTGTDHLRTTLPGPSWSALCRGAAGHGLEPGDVLLAAYAETLRTWAKEPTFRLAVTGRAASVEAGGVGNLTLPSLLAVAAGPASTFAERAAALAARAREDRENQGYSGIRVLRELGRRSGSRPSAPVVFTDARTPGHCALSAFGEPVAVGTRTPQIWLEQQIFDLDGGLLVVWNAAAGLFPDGLVADLAAAHTALLQRLAADREAWTRTGAAVPLPPAHAAAQAAANATAAPIPAARLHDLVGAAAARTPDGRPSLTPGAPPRSARSPRWPTASPGESAAPLPTSRLACRWQAPDSPPARRWRCRCARAPPRSRPCSASCTPVAPTSPSTRSCRATAGTRCCAGAGCRSSSPVPPTRTTSPRASP